MKTYTIYTNKSNLIAIKKGWSWPAFFFGPFWGFTKGFWIGDVIILILMLAISIALVAQGKSGSPGLLVAIIYGIKGNKWWVSRITNKGYSETDSLQAPNANSAIMLYQQMR